MPKFFEHLTVSMILVLVGALLAAIGAFWSTYTQNVDRVRSAQERAAFERGLREKSDEIARLNQEIVQQVTGGDSVAYLSIASPGEDAGILTAMTEGDYPVFDVSVRMVDLQKSAKLKPTFPEIFAADTNFSLGNIPPKRATLLGTIELGRDERRDFNVFITSRNRAVTQLIRCRKVDGVWRIASKVMAEGTKDALLEKIDPSFPRNEAGEIEW